MFGFKKNKKLELNDSVFGELTYTYCWEGISSVSFLGELRNLDLYIYVDENKKISEIQKTNYLNYLHSQLDYDGLIKDAIKHHFNFSEERLFTKRFEPSSIVLKKNGDFALMFIDKEEDEESSNFCFAVALFPKVQYFGTEESYLSEVYLE